MQLGISEMREPGQIWKSKNLQVKKNERSGRQVWKQMWIDNVLVPAGKDDEMQISN